MGGSVGDISPAAQLELRSEIAAAGGNEVFFFGTLDGDGMLVAVEVHARGNAGEVPVFLERAGSHHVLIHNHPSGDLTPSPADLTIASEAGIRGLGFFIISNDATRMYRAVEPFPKFEEVLLDEDEIAEIFASRGLLAVALPGFEERPGQRDLAVSVARAMNGKQVVAFEGGTGIGKSYAYLVPAILWAVRNKSRVVVSTQTIALGEQLMRKDLPTLARILPEPFTFHLMKGRSNYACLRKTGDVAREPALLAEEPGHEHWIAEILQHLEGGGGGSLSELPRVPPAAVWDAFESTTEQSLKTRCKHYRECFYYEARRHAARAHIVVVNHHLFFSDLALRRTSGNFSAELVIPGYRRVVFDEAHRLEEVAAQHLGAQVSQVGVLQSLARFAGTARRSDGSDTRRGRFPYLASILAPLGQMAQVEFLNLELIPRVATARSAAAALFAEMRRSIAGAVTSAGDGERAASMARIGDAPGDLSPATLAEPVDQLRARLEELLDLVRRGRNRLMDAPFEPEERWQASIGEYRAAFRALEGMLGALSLFRAPLAGMLAWVELRAGKRPNLLLRVAPVRVGEVLAGDLYGAVDHVLMTSATLAVQGKWDFLGDRLGWTLLPEGRFQGRDFPSPFDFPRQALLALPTDVAEPDTTHWRTGLERIVLDAARVARGRTFVLFTSHELLRDIAGRTRATLAGEGFPVLVQGEIPRTELLRRFQS
ncbi:MAG: DEAD/DEAH box helicase family protein, partial [Planctomycetes bacterium]|nr:DEAD/DEAH box helicase family protein [Planctomycetota bacterium]